MRREARRDRRRALRGLAASVLLLGAASRSLAAKIVAVRVWPASDYSRVTIESDEPLAARHLVTEAPHRLVVDIEPLQLGAALRELVGKVQPDDPHIAGVRVGQFQPRVVRLVFDLKRPVLPQQFASLPVAAYQHRLMFDLHPTTPRDPLLELIREREQAIAEAERGMSDALGEFIGRLERPGVSNGIARAPAASASSSAPAHAPHPPHLPEPVITAEEQRQVDRLVVVALDPGHGGEDPGAIGPSGLREKDVVLAIALELRDRLNAMPGMRAMLTRDGDYFVPLHERVRKARRVQADLLVSIHADAFYTPEARGASVFALSDKGATSAMARWMASKENAADAVGGVNRAVARDPQLRQAMLDMSTAAQIRDSLALGREVLQRIGRVGRLHKRQVEQAGFAVLKAPDIPSILVETAFISNPREEEQLRDPAFQASLADELAVGIRRYFARNPPLARHRVL